MKYSVVLLASLLLSPLAGPALQAQSKPNIVFIYADDWGWGDLSCHGHSFLKTPNLDRLAAEGTDFQQFNVLNPVCSPSRTAALTGRYPARFGINNVFGGGLDGTPEMPDWLDGKAPTTPRYLKAAGYRTAHFGKWHLGSDGPQMADYGIDESAVYNGPGPKVSPSGPEIVDHAVKFIEAHKGSPFYMNVWLHESHLAHSPSAESMEKWKHLDEQKQVYAAVITDGDNKVGMILDALEKAGIAQNTLVAFSSDNGPESTGEANKKDKGGEGKYGSYYSVGETGGLRGRKRSLYEGGVRVPFIVRWPGHTKTGFKNDTTVFTAVDLLPTFCAAAGVTLPDDAKGDGENLIGAFNGETTPRTRPIFWLHKGKAAEPDWWPRLAVRDGNLKLLMTYGAERVELHDLSSDRAEAMDVSKDHPEVVAKLSKLLLDWYATLPTEADPTCLSKPRDSVPKQREKKSKGPEVKMSTKDRNIPFNRWDTNKDEFLSLEEYKAGLSQGDDLESRFKSFDKDRDSKVSRKEFVTPSGARATETSN
ncbi:MAG: sulfatase-like hydrolase/transferase [Prosthecobacter sp.]|uniref:sulfatase-like hydrolase/transferase n=1 Tax=Prosthecobacter sp. TaxID=1965333 RepID=UPI003900E7A6